MRFGLIQLIQSSPRIQEFDRSEVQRNEMFSVRKETVDTFYFDTLGVIQYKFFSIAETFSYFIDALLGD